MKPDSPIGRSRSGRSALLTGGLAAILASTCCLGPLVLITLGISGAWISNLTLLEPYRPVFIGVAALALVFAYRRIWRASAACEPGQVCARPEVRRGYKTLIWIVLGLVIIPLGFPLIAPWFY